MFVGRAAFVNVTITSGLATSGNVTWTNATGGVADVQPLECSTNGDYCTSPTSMTFSTNGTLTPTVVVSDGTTSSASVSCGELVVKQVGARAALSVLLQCLRTRG